MEVWNNPENENSNELLTLKKLVPHGKEWRSSGASSKFLSLLIRALLSIMGLAVHNGKAL
jgi:hypothetical protein